MTLCGLSFELALLLPPMGLDFDQNAILVSCPVVISDSQNQTVDSTLKLTAEMLQPRPAPVPQATREYGCYVKPLRGTGGVAEPPDRLSQPQCRRQATRAAPGGSDPAISDPRPLSCPAPAGWTEPGRGHEAASFVHPSHFRVESTSGRAWSCDRGGEPEHDGWSALSSQ